VAGTRPRNRFNKVIEIFLWLAGLGVLAENVFLFLQNRRLNEALAPQITAGTQLQTLAGIGFDGRLELVTLPSVHSKLLITFSPGCPLVRQIRKAGRGWQAPSKKRASACSG
jgi:hypothetical protein